MKKRGRGIACMWYPIGFTVTANPGAATVKMNEDGTVIVQNGTVEIGQGSLTVLAQIAAEELGVAPADVHQFVGDDGLDLRQCFSRNDRPGKHNHRPKQAENGRADRFGGYQQGNLAPHTQLLGKLGR